jgi:hypothetical protein
VRTSTSTHMERTPVHLTTPLQDLTAPDNTALRRMLRDNARYMALRGGPSSPEAQGFVEALLQQVNLPADANGKAVRSSSLVQRRAALGAVLADLLTAAADGAWAQRSVRKEAFTGLVVGRAAFEPVRAALAANGLLEVLPGYSSPKAGRFGRQAEAPCFRAAGKLTGLAAAQGIMVQDVDQHFRLKEPQAAKAPNAAPAFDLIEARAAVTINVLDGSKAPGKAMSLIDHNGRVAAMRARVASINDYLLEGDRVSGFAFGGVRRVFSNADQPGFDWQWHGRLYSRRGWDAYETWRGGSEKRQARIKIDGERVAEADIAASHLTILHGLLGEPFHQTVDAYAIPGFSRAEVKAWVAMAIGASKSTIGGNKVAAVRKAVLAHHPILQGLEGHGISIHDLFYHESEILMDALETLRDREGVLALPIHDGVIISASKAALGREVLKDAFSRYFKDTLGMTTVIIPKVA